MKKLYRIKTVDGEGMSNDIYTVIATTADEAIAKVTPKLNGDLAERIEEIEVVSEINIE
jgi:hypothetical protein